MPYTLSNLLRDAITQKGRSAYRMISATGGSTATIIDTKLGPDYTDDDESLVRGTALITFDAGGAGAAPEGEFQRISAYSESSTQVTVDTAFSAAVAADDKAMLITSQFPIDELVRLANQALQDLGFIALVDTTLTTGANQTEYTLPVGLKFKTPLRVEIQSQAGDANDNQWHNVSSFRYVPAAPGSTGLLILPQWSAGYTIKVWYEGVHPTLTAYSSVISETIHPSYIAWALTASIWDWTEPDNPIDLRRRDAAVAMRDRAGLLYPVWKPAPSPQFATFGQGSGRRYPGDQTIIS